MWRPDINPTLVLHKVWAMPEQVIYEFDEPVLFVATVGISQLLFLKIGDEAEQSRYLTARLEPSHFDALLRSELSLRGAIVQNFYAVIDLDEEWRVVQFWDIPADQIPEEWLPKAGVGLDASIQWVPDTMEQSTAFFAVRFSGDELRTERMPFQTLKKLTSDFYDAIRRLLVPPQLAGAKSSTFDFPVHEPEFGSLIIALEKPTINLQAVRRFTRDEAVLADDVFRQFADRNSRFFEALSFISNQTRQEDLPDNLADQYYSFIEEILNITPSDRVPFEKVEFSGRVAGEIRYVSIDLASGQRIRRAYERMAGRERALVGTVSILNDNSRTFVMNLDGGRKVTCSLTEEHYGMLKADPEFKTGARVTATGGFFRRTQRDLLEVSSIPEILPPLRDE